MEGPDLRGITVMSETLVTIVGNVATQPELKQTSTGVPVTRFRLATTERRYDRTEERWNDGHTSFYTVWAWRTLGENVAGSVGIGEPLVVQGRLRVHEREDKGQGFVSASIDAVAVGHDMSRGTSAFRRVLKARAELVDPLPDPSPPAKVQAKSMKTGDAESQRPSEERELVPS